MLGENILFPNNPGSGKWALLETSHSSSRDFFGDCFLRGFFCSHETMNIIDLQRLEVEAPPRPVAAPVQVPFRGGVRDMRQSIKLGEQ